MYLRICCTLLRLVDIFFPPIRFWSTHRFITFSQTGKEYFDTENGVEWLKEEECLTKKNISKKHIFVLEEFNGDAFDYLTTTKAL